MQELTAAVVAFRDARDWKQFHTPKDTAVSLALEAAEVLELMQWRNGDELETHLEANHDALGHELSDVLYWVLLIAHDQGIDLGRAFRDKLSLNEVKYPVAKSHGSARKYTEFEDES
ncbi:MAG: nucleotide pyrophosphohydrolase [Blastocatellia bacterium]|nr:nucleotide pyrophosphohydrolase [Blastocatellia bacterium]